VGGTSDNSHAANLIGLQSVVDANDPSRSIALEEGARNPWVAWSFTIWGAAVETAVAATFLLPLPRRWAWARHAALIAFAATTYLIVPIGGFGALLLVLGATMVETARARAAYVVGGLVLACWAGIWPTLFL
jgi:hypothetical protein